MPDQTLGRLGHDSEDDQLLDRLINIAGIPQHAACSLLWGRRSGNVDPGPAPTYATTEDALVWGRAWVKHRARHVFADVHTWLDGSRP